MSSIASGAFNLMQVLCMCICKLAPLLGESGQDNLISMALLFISAQAIADQAEGRVEFLL